MRNKDYITDVCRLDRFENNSFVVKFDVDTGFDVCFLMIARAKLTS